MESDRTVAPLRPAAALRSSYDVMELTPIRYPFALEYFDMGCEATFAYDGARRKAHLEATPEQTACGTETCEVRQ